MHAITLVTIYNYVLFGFRSNIIFIILYDLQYSDLCVYLIRDPILFLAPVKTCLLVFCILFINAFN